MGLPAMSFGYPGSPNRVFAAAARDRRFSPLLLHPSTPTRSTPQASLPPMTPSPAPIPFTPPDANVPSILRALASPAYSLTQIAEACHTSLEALTLWMTTPAIREQLESSDAIAAWRTSYTARQSLSKSIASLDEILSENLTQRREHIAQSLAAKSTPAESLRNQIIETRHTESIRRCASLMLRLSRLPAPPPIPTAPSAQHTRSAHAPDATHTPSASPSDSRLPADPVAQDSTDLPTPSPTHSPRPAAESPETPPETPPDSPPVTAPPLTPALTPVSEFLGSPHNPPDPSEVTCEAPRGPPISEHWP